MANKKKNKASTSLLLLCAAFAVAVILALVMCARTARMGSMIDQLSERNTELSGQVETLTAQTAADAETITGLNDANAELTGQVETLTAQTAADAETITGLNGTNTELSGQVETLTSTNTELSGQVETLTGEKNALQEQVTALSAVSDTNDETIATLTAKAAEDAETIAALQTQVDELTAAAGEIAALEAENTDLSAQLAIFRAAAGPIVGSWYLDGASDGMMILNEDGTGTLTQGDTTGTCAWKASQITVTMEDGTTQTFSMTGDTLVAADAEEPVVYTRQEPGAENIVAVDDVMATVNGEAITRGYVDGVYAELASYYGNNGYDVTSPDAAAVLQASALSTAVSYVVINQKAEELGLSLTADELTAAEEQARAEWSSVIDQYVAYYGGLSAEATDEEKQAARDSIVTMMTSAGYSEEQFVREYVENEIHNRVRAHVAEGVTVTDEEVIAAFESYVAEDQAQYEGHIDVYEYMTQYYGYPSYYQPAGYRGAIHILLPVDADLLTAWSDAKSALASGAEGASQEAVDAAEAAILASVQDKVDEINTRLAAGEDFYALMDEFGTDPGMAAEPNRSNGYSVHKDSIAWASEFVQAAFSVDNVGDVSAPVVSSFGVHIVKYLRDVPAGAVELTDELKESIRGELQSSAAMTAWNTALDGWMAEAQIVYSEEGQAVMDQADAVIAAAQAEASAEEVPAEEAPVEEAPVQTENADPNQVTGENMPEGWLEAPAVQ